MKKTASRSAKMLLHVNMAKNSSGKCYHQQYIIQNLFVKVKKLVQANWSTRKTVQVNYAAFLFRAYGLYAIDDFIDPF